MYISLNWLKDFVNIPSKVTPADIALKLTAHTAEVEGFIDQSRQFDKVVVGKVLEVSKHPNADRLRLALVDIKTEKLRIVCGAPNLAEGQLVPVALVGAILPGGLEIKESEIRGEKSSGMICAEDELGLGENHEGIIVLKNNAKVGESFAKYLKIDDTVFELDNKSLSNRPDLLSHYGIARELGVTLDLKLKPYEKFINKSVDFLVDKNNELNVKVENKEACPRYMAVKIDNIEIKESPAWLKNRLIAVNQKPINNIVDLTNYILLELGQPLHAFCASRVKKIVVRYAKEGERLETLDEKERVLGSEDLLITDGEKALAIAGIMGGKDSGVSLDTTSIVLEAANFNAPVIRKTSQKLGLRTESSTRYEKALDPLLTEEALFRFINLLFKILPKAKIASPLIDLNQAKVLNKEIELDLDWLNKKIGQVIPQEKVISNLERLGFVVNLISDRKFKVLVPSWRATKDVSIKEDLAEEVLRVHGYDNIKSQLPLEILSCPEINQERVLERKIKTFLALRHSLSEVYNYSFVGEEQLKKLNIDFFKHLRLANPASDVHTMLRQSLVPNLVNNIKSNQAKAEEIGLFEVGSVFFNAPGNLPKEASGDETIPYQEKHLGIALAGEEKNIFLRVKGIISNLLENLLGYDLEVKFLELLEAPGWINNKEAARIVVAGREIGVVGSLSKLAATNINLKKKAVLAEINIKDLFSLVSQFSTNKFKELAKYPALIRDLAFVIDKKILYNDIKTEMINFDQLIKRVDLFDVYIGDKLSANEKSLAFHLTFQSSERTLVAEEVDELINKLLKHLHDRFEARLRD